MVATCEFVVWLYALISSSSSSRKVSAPMLMLPLSSSLTVVFYRQSSSMISISLVNSVRCSSSVFMYSVDLLIYEMLSLTKLMSSFSYLRLVLSFDIDLSLVSSFLCSWSFLRNSSAFYFVSSSSCRAKPCAFSLSISFSSFNLMYRTGSFGAGCVC